MAGRIRTIKPEWNEDEKLLLASPSARVLSVSMILMADDHGRGGGNIDLIVSRIFPRHSREGREGFRELYELGFFRLFRVRGQTFFEIQTWGIHQRVDKPGKPRTPIPCESDYVGLDNLPETLANLPGSLATDHDHDHDHEQDHDHDRERCPQEKKARGRKADPLALYLEDAAKVWEAQEGGRAAIPGTRPLKATPDRIRRIAARMADGASVDDCLHVIDVYTSQALRDPGQAKWHNGDTPWRAENFDRALGQSPHAGEAMQRADGTLTPAGIMAIADRMDARGQ